MIIIPKFLNSGKTPTRQLIEENKRKLEFLNLNGIKVKIDGSWGPWLLEWYNRIRTRQTKTKPKLNWFTRSTVGAAMAENPAVMTASGWKQDKLGDYILKRTKESDQLAENLAVISWMAPSHPGNVIIDAIINKGVFPLIKFTANKALETAAKTGNNYARTRIINRELNQQIKNFNGIVSEAYFNSPYNLYRISRLPSLKNTPYAPTYFMEGTTANGFPVVGRTTVKWDNTSARGKVFNGLLSDEGSERAVYNSFNPGYVLKVEDTPYTFEQLAGMKPRNNPFVPEPTIGVVLEPGGNFYRVTKQERVPVIPRRYSKKLEQKIADYLYSKGYLVYKDKYTGRLDAATKDGVFLNDLGPGNIGFTESGEVKIIDPNFLNIKDLPDWNERLIPW